MPINSKQNPLKISETLINNHYSTCYNEYKLQKPPEKKRKIYTSDHNLKESMFHKNIVWSFYTKENKNLSFSSKLLELGASNLYRYQELEPLCPGST